MTYEDQMEYVRLFDGAVYVIDGAACKTAKRHILYTELQRKPTWAAYVMLRSQYEHREIKRLDAKLIQAFGSLDINDFTSDYIVQMTAQKVAGKQTTHENLLGRLPERTTPSTLKRSNTGAVSITTTPSKPKTVSTSSTTTMPSKLKTASASSTTTTPLKRKAASTLSINTTNSKRMRPKLDIQPMLPPKSILMSELRATMATFPQSKGVASRILELVESLVETVNEIKAEQSDIKTQQGEIRDLLNQLISNNEASMNEGSGEEESGEEEHIKEE